MSDYGKRLHAALLDEYRDCNDTDTPSEVLHRVLDAVRAANSAPALAPGELAQGMRSGTACDDDAALSHRPPASGSERGTGEK